MSADHEFMVTLFPTQQAFAKSERKFTAKELAELIRQTRAPTKAELPWFKLGSFGERRTEKNCLRHNANLKWVSGIEADYDQEKIAFDQAVNLLHYAGIASITYTSGSHKEDKPRWRILCPFSLGRQPDQRNIYLARLNGLFGGVFSPESWTLSQAFYYGKAGDGYEHRVAEVYGTFIDSMDELDAGAIGKPIGQGKTADPGDTEAGEDTRKDAELIRLILTMESLHPSLCSLAARYVARNMPSHVVIESLRGFMLATPDAERDDRWNHRYSQIPKLVTSAAAKFVKTDNSGWRAIARATHKTRKRGSGADIKAAVLAEAERSGIAPDKALKLAASILRDIREASTNAV